MYFRNRILTNMSSINQHVIQLSIRCCIDCTLSIWHVHFSTMDIHIGIGKVHQTRAYLYLRNDKNLLAICDATFWSGKLSGNGSLPFQSAHGNGDIALRFRIGRDSDSRQLLKHTSLISFSACTWVLKVWWTQSYIHSVLYAFIPFLNGFPNNDYVRLDTFRRSEKPLVWKVNWMKET